MLDIERGSEAFRHLERIFADSDTHTVHLTVREDVQQVAIKRNEGMWTAPLLATAPRVAK